MHSVGKQKAVEGKGVEQDFTVWMVVGSSRAVRVICGILTAGTEWLRTRCRLKIGGNHPVDWTTLIILFDVTKAWDH